MVQLEVILLLLGLCRSSSSSLLVGSQLEYFSPVPGRRRPLKKCGDAGGNDANVHPPVDIERLA